jgi:hypothetical protein
MNELKEKFNNWCEEFSKAKTEPMSDEITKVFLIAVISKRDGLSVTNKGIEDEFLYKVIDKRAEHINLKIDDYTKVFLMFLTKSPGTAVMFLYYLKYVVEKTKLSLNSEVFSLQPNIEIDMERLSVLYPLGFPTESELERLWDLQKVSSEHNHSDNLLDLINPESI